MDEAGSEDAYDDADFNDLPPGTLQQLEQRAVSSTQQGRPIGEERQASWNHAAAHAQSEDSPNLDDEGPPSSDYGLDDEDVIDLDKPAEQQTLTTRITQHVPRAVDEVTHRTNWRQSRYGGHTEQQALRSPIAKQQPRPTHAHLSAGKGYANGVSKEQARDQIPVQTSEGSDVSALQGRIAQLEEAHARLSKENEDAKAASYAKAGEIAIIRANQERVAREYESKMAALQRRQTEELARRQSELDMSRKQREKLETNSKFLEHEFAQEAERARNTKKAPIEPRGSAGKRISGPSPLSTPQKPKSLPFRDGFDDGEVVAPMSPSKGKAKAKPSTPRAVGKRKRNGLQPESPVAPLSFTESEAAIECDSEPAPQIEPRAISLPLRPQPPTHDDLIEFTQTIINHRSRRNERTVEVLTSRRFTSTPDASLASHLYDALRLSSPMPSIHDFRMHICDRLLDLWSRCLEEKHYVSITEITDMIELILTTSPLPLSAAIVPRAVPLCIATADLIAVPRAKASKSPNTPASLDPNIEAHINAFDYLELLHLLALHCRQEGESHIHAFLSLLEHDFILLILAKAQPLSQITIMLRILSASVLTNSFGATASPARSRTSDPAALSARQTKTQYEIISRLTVLLFDVPTPPTKRLSAPPSDHRPSTTPPNPALAREPNLVPSKAHYTPLALLRLRHTVLTLLRSITLQPHGLSAFCAHRLALGRLVRFLHEQVLELYKYRRSTHAMTSALVNAATLLLAHVEITGQEREELDLRGRLAAEPGGSYKHLVALGRVAFAEGQGVADVRKYGGGSRREKEDGDAGEGSEDGEDNSGRSDGEQEQMDRDWTGGMEGGISAAASEAALRLLDECLSPEEGEAVVSVFSSGR